MCTCESTTGATAAAYPDLVLRTQLERLVRPLTPDEIRARYVSCDVPRVPLALLPTPLQEAPHLARALGIGRLLIKRDDLTGLAFGGNKARNLEFRMAEAVQEGAEVFIAGLEAQSNSARMSTAAANLLGMQTILLLRDDLPQPSENRASATDGAGTPTAAEGGTVRSTREWQGNLLVDRLLGAEVRFVSIGERATASDAMDRALRETAEEVRRAGKKPYVMNHAGAFSVGSALAYLLCSLEINEQADAMD